MIPVEVVENAEDRLAELEDMAELENMAELEEMAEEVIFVVLAQ